MRQLPDHPEVAMIERTGYPSWMQPKDLDCDGDWDYDDDDDWEDEYG